MYSEEKKSALLGEHITKCLNIFEPKLKEACDNINNQLWSFIKPWETTQILCENISSTGLASKNIEYLMCLAMLKRVSELMASITLCCKYIDALRPTIEFIMRGIFEATTQLSCIASGITSIDELVKKELHNGIKHNYFESTDIEKMKKFLRDKYITNENPIIDSLEKRCKKLDEKYGEKFGNFGGIYGVVYRSKSSYVHTNPISLILNRDIERWRDRDMYVLRTKDINPKHTELWVSLLFIPVSVLKSIQILTLANGSIENTINLTQKAIETIYEAYKSIQQGTT